MPLTPHPPNIPSYASERGGEGVCVCVCVCVCEGGREGWREGGREGERERERERDDHTSSSIEGSFKLPTSVRVRQPEDVLDVRMMLFLGFDAHWTNRSREYPHSRSGILANTACERESEHSGRERGGGERGEGEGHE